MMATEQTPLEDPGTELFPEQTPEANEAEIAFWRTACAGKGGKLPPVLVLGTSRAHVAYALAKAGHDVLIVESSTEFLFVMRSMTGSILNHRKPSILEPRRYLRQRQRELRARGNPSLFLLDADPCNLDLSRYARYLKNISLPMVFHKIIVPGLSFMEIPLRRMQEGEHGIGDAPDFAEELAHRFERIRAHLSMFGQLIVRTNNPLMPAPILGSTRGLHALHTVEPWVSCAGTVDESSTVSGFSEGTYALHTNMRAKRTAWRDVQMRWIRETDLQSPVTTGFAPPRQIGGYAMEPLTSTSPFCLWSFIRRG